MEPSNNVENSYTSFVLVHLTSASHRCLDVCTESGYLYAGVQYGVECFCGNERPLENSNVEESRCNKFCPGNSDAKCGGYLTMNVYQTGVIPFKAEPARDDEDSKAEALRNPVRIVYLVSFGNNILQRWSETNFKYFVPSSFHS